LKQNRFCCAVIAAAGNSTRMGVKCPKQFLPLLGVPVIIRTLAAFERSETVSAAVVVCREEDTARMRDLLREWKIRKVCAVVPGGESRQESVAAGLAAVPPEADYVAVHDGARALICPEEIDACVRDCFATGASALAVPVKDTIKVVDSQCRVLSTPDRSALWAVQTPQVFERNIYQRALEEAKRRGGDYTDDCQLAEHIGAPVHLCEGSYENIKLTTPEDLCLAEAILRKRGEHS
jgi:2-C-methyl-D-erythritol 4-phosphate cytidylyltransferase